MYFGDNYMNDQIWIINNITVRVEDIAKYLQIKNYDLISNMNIFTFLLQDNCL